MGEECGTALCYTHSQAGDRAGFIQAASELVTAMGTCGALIQQWHPRAQVLLAGLGLAAGKRSSALKINIAPHAIGNRSPFLGHRKEGWSMRELNVEQKFQVVQCKCFICI